MSLAAKYWEDLDVNLPLQDLSRMQFYFYRFCPMDFDHYSKSSHVIL